MNLSSLLAKLRAVIENVVLSAEAVPRRENTAEKKAVCALLMEVARLDSTAAPKKREVVAQVMRQQFAISDEELLAMIANAARPENRLTSYFGPVALINKRFTSEQKTQFIEGLWRIATAEGTIDMYEEHLVRLVADLLYVPHADFILGKHRAQAGPEH